VCLSALDLLEELLVISSDPSLFVFLLFLETEGLGLRFVEAAWGRRYTTKIRVNLLILQ